MTGTTTLRALDRRPSGGAHLVTFHEDDAALVSAIVDHIAPGLRGDRAALVIADPHRWEDLASGLTDAGVDVDTVTRNEQLQLIGAADLLGRISTDGSPDPAKFQSIIGELVTRAEQAWDGVDAFGEMVALLYGQGDVIAALRLEQMWNRLADEHRFELLCGYPTSMVEGDEDTQTFHAICEAHNGISTSTVVPTSAASARLTREAAVHQARAEGEDERDRLRDEVDDLQSVDRMRRRFTAMVVHDIRSPNAIVEGSLQLLLDAWDELDADEARELLARSLRQTRRVARLADDILTMSKLETGEFTYDLRELDLGALVDEAVAELEGARGWDVELDLAAGLPLVVADEGRQFQILENLLSNAVKFGGGGPALVEVRATASTVEVEVRDDGDGMSAEELGQLFRPFSRAPGGRRNGSGTGLGLYITRALVEGQGGEITVDSTPGVGSTFTYSVPVSRPR